MSTEPKSNLDFSNANKNTKVIKRYQNRKLYNTHQSRYLTLDDIAEMIRQGDEVRVIENKTKRDITSTTLTLIAFNSEKKEQHGIPLSVLREIIRYGNGTLSGYLAKLGAFSKEDFEKQADLNWAQQSVHDFVKPIAQQEKMKVDHETTDSSVAKSVALLALISHDSNLNELEAPNLPTSSLNQL